MKGESIVVYFVLTIIVLAIGLIFFNKVKNWVCFLNPFLCYKTKLEMALQCSMVRCLEGCDSPMIKKLERGDFKCSNFCSEAWTDTTGKICNEKSYAYPVVVNLDEDKEYTKDQLDVDCIIYNKDLELSFFEKLWEAIKKDKTGNPKYIYLYEDLFDENYKKEEKETCWVTFTPFFNSLKKFSLYNKNINIFTFHRKWLFLSSTINYIWYDCCSDCTCETKDSCNTCSKMDRNNCFFVKSCKKIDDIECTDGSPEDICFEIASLFCSKEMKNVISAGCINGKCEYKCGKCDGIENFENFNQCMKSRCEKIPYESKECCKFIKSCEDYNSYYCTKNPCQDIIGNCAYDPVSKNCKPFG